MKNPVDDFLKVAVSREKIEAAIDKLKREESKLRHERRSAQVRAAKGQGPAVPQKASPAEIKARRRLKRLEGAYERRLYGSGIKAKYFLKSGKPLKPGGKPYTFAKTKADIKAARKAEAKERLSRSIKRREPAGARLRVRHISPAAERAAKEQGRTLGQIHAERKTEAYRQARGRAFEGRGALRKRKAVKVTKPAVPKMRAGGGGAPSKPATGATKQVVKAVKKGRGWGRAAKALGAAGLLAGAGYGAYRLLKGKEKAAMAPMLPSFFSEMEEIDARTR